MKNRTLAISTGYYSQQNIETERYSNHYDSAKEPTANTNNPHRTKTTYLSNVTRQVAINPFTQQPVPAITISKHNLMIEPKHVFRHFTLGAAINGVADVSPRRPFYIYVSTFSRKTIPLLNHMVIAWTAKPATVIHAKYPKRSKVSQIGTAENDIKVHSVQDKDAARGIQTADDDLLYYSNPSKNR